MFAVRDGAALLLSGAAVRVPSSAQNAAMATSNAAVDAINIRFAWRRRRFDSLRMRECCPLPRRRVALARL
jgi:hypothetical protein